MDWKTEKFRQQLGYRDKCLPINIFINRPISVMQLKLHIIRLSLWQKYEEASTPSPSVGI